MNRSKSLLNKTLRIAGRAAKSAARPRGILRAAALEALEQRRMLDAVPVGPELQVNTFTTGNQYVVGPSRPVAMDPNGNFVVTWESYGQDGSVEGVYARRYDASGTPLGSEFVVSTTTLGRQKQPSIGMDADGDFVIVWHSNHMPGYFPNIYGRRFNASGVPQGDEFIVSETTTVFNQSPVVALDADGDFVIAWESQRLGSPQYEVYARRFDAAGNALGSEFLINGLTTMADRFPSIAMDADGDFVVTWMHGQGFFGYDIYARRFDAAGAALGGDFMVNSLTTQGQSLPSIGMDGSGNFVIAWERTIVNPLDFPDIYARRFNASGAAQGSEFLVNTTTSSFQRYPSVAVEPDGDFVVVYSSDYLDGSGTAIAAQRFAADGSASGNEFQINTYTVGGQDQPMVAIDADGDFVVVWNSMYNQDGDGVGIFAQRYEIVAGPVSWDGGGDGVNWSDPMNWSGDALPGPSDDVIISVAGNKTIQINGSTQSINSLDSDEAIVVLNGGTLELADTSTIADFTLNAGTLAGDGNLTITETFNWVNGAQRGDGTTIIPVGAHMDLSFGFLLRTLEISGTATHSGSDNLFFGDNVGNPGSGVLHIKPGGVFNHTGEGDFGQLSVGSPHQIINEGTINRSGPGTTVYGGLDIAFTNNGTVNLNEGAINFFTVSLTNNGSIVTSPGTALSFSTEGTYGAASSITGTASAHFIFGTHSFGPGNYALTGPITLDGGTVNFNQSLTVPNFTHNGGTLGGSGDLTVTGNYTWVAGFQRGDGKTIIPSGATMDITFGFLVRTLEISGTATHDGGVGNNIFFGENSPAIGTLHIKSGGVWNSVGEGAMSQLGGTGQHAIINEGTFNRSGVGTTNIGGIVTFTNHGVINLNEGGLALHTQGGFVHNGSIVTASGTALTLNTEGTYGAASTITGPASVTFLSGTHTFNAGNYALTGPITLDGGTANFTDSFSVPSVTHNGGTLGGSGTLTVTNNYTWVAGAQGGSGTTRIAPGATMNITFGFLVRRLEVAGTATHSGVVGENIFFGDNSADPGVLHILAGGVWNSVGQGAISQLGGTGPHQIINEGTFNRSGTGTTHISGNNAFTNHGTVNLNAGGLQFNNTSLTNNGSIVTASGTALTLNTEGTYGAASTITGPASVTFLSGTHTFNAGNYALTGPITLDGGTANFTDSFSVPSVTHNGGTLGGSGDLTVTGNYTWGNGIQRGAGKTIIPAGATMGITFGFLARTLEIAGTATLSGVVGDRIFLGEGIGGSGIIDVQVGGVFNLVGPVAIGPAGGSNHGIINNGTINRSGDGMSVITGDSFTFTNAGTIDVQAGNLTISLTSMTSTGTLRAGAGATLTMGNTATVLAAGSVDGAGDVIFAGALEWSGGAMTGTGKSIFDGVLNMTGTGLRDSSREIDIRFFATMQAGGSLVLRTTALTIAPGAFLDMNDNALIVDYGAADGSPLTDIRTALTSGYNGGFWNGPGIRSSVAAATPNRALGYAESSAIFSNFPAIFAGQQVDNTTVLVRYTRNGDADLNGVVNLNDFNRLAAAFGQTGTVWSQGNFNFDNNTNLNDFNLLAANFGQMAAPNGRGGSMSFKTTMDDESGVEEELV